MSTSESGASGGRVTLDQFIALNDELAALVRAGVPLERGLIDSGRDLRGRLGVVSAELGRRMAEGAALPEAIEASSGQMPEMYRAVVEAGFRSGRLSEALEGMAAIARGYSEARRAVGMAMLYPLIVACLAYGLAVAFIVQTAPRFAAAFQSLGLAPIGSLDLLARIGVWAIYWAPILPILLALAAIRWAWTGRAVVLDGGPLSPLLNHVPMIGLMIRNFRAANFAGLLSLLLEHRVPLDEAVRLAGSASGDRDFKAASGRFAEAIRRGEVSDGVALEGPGGFPPLLAWMLTAGHRQGDLSRALATWPRPIEARPKGGPTWSGWRCLRCACSPSASAL